MSAANKSITEKTSVVNLQSPKALANFSKELKKFIVDNKLYSEIGEKNFVQVEGWQFAGISMGIIPIVEKVEDVSPDNQEFEYESKYGKKAATIYKYRAEVKLVRLSTGEVVGYGVAVCSNVEKKKNTFDEYAVASMAQTRAVGKAFRGTLGWIMKLAGYEATTAEEAEAIVVDQEPEPTTVQSDVPIDDVKYLVSVKLATKSSSEKVSFLKEHAGTVSDKSLTDEQYRRLYAVLTKEAAQ